jgi:pyruvate dehydrogenase E2 component (dihydrolipoamide acetyltransferase)
LAKEVIMPALGMAQETGVLLQWLKAEGEEITAGEPLMEIETDKATVEVEAPASGVLANLTAAPGDEVPVGQVIGLILAPGESVPSTATASEPTPSSQPAAPHDGTAEVLASPLAARIAAEHSLDLNKLAKPDGSRIQKEDVLTYLDTRRPGRPLASPKARRLAAEQNLDLATIEGSGPQGAVIAADVEEAATAQKAAAQPLLAPVPTIESRTEPVSRMWHTMVERLSRSWTTVPHFYLTREVQAGQLLAWWDKAQQRTSEKITLTDLLVKVVAAALDRHPRLNGMWQNNAVLLNEEINVGLAVAVEAGLVVPVIHRADQLGLNELAARRREVVGRAQSSKLTLEDLHGGTFTLSNLGMYGIDAFNAIVNPPQAAILAVGRIADRVVPVDGQPGVRPMMNLTLSCDHRVVDGARAAQFLQTLVTFIEDPLAVLD